MGGYLSEPIRDKESSDYVGENLICGASSMQGWRATQEDAHNCFISYDENASLFAVYDGHGGHEVAEYAANHLPDYIKELKEYKEGDYEKALINAFLGFDAALAKPEVVTILKRIAQSKEPESSKVGAGGEASNRQSDDEEDETEDEENLEHLCQEAHMPLDQLMDKYRKESSGRFKFSSPCIRKKDDGPSGSGTSASTSSEANGDDGEVSSSSSMPKSGPSASLTNGEVDMNGDINEDVNGGSSEAGSSSVDKCNGNATDSKSHSDTTCSSSGAGSSSTKSELPDSSSQSKNEEKGVSSSSNGDLSNSNDETEKITSSSPEKKEFVKRATTLTSKLLCLPGEDDSDTDSEDDETFEGDAAESSDEDEGATLEGDGEEGEEEEDEDGDEEYMEDEEDESEFSMPFNDQPGSDSGCTAVVALLKGNELFVANAGDSRCVVCRDGQAIEMSIDHKPEDKIEMDRIIAAGGKVSRDGRVNGGLNLSRALGDHSYKQVTTLPATEQMVTALPDVKKLEIDPAKDEFIVLACDGIWNYMSSQDVVDFVRPRLNERREKISTICEELFDHCLAPNTLGDGTGCDNMTCIIVQLKQSGINGHESAKRPASSMEEEKTTNSEETSSKRQKIEETTTPVEPMSN